MGSGKSPNATGAARPSWPRTRSSRRPTANLMVTAANDDQFARLCDALGFPDLATDPSYRQNADRVANRAALHDLLQARFLERPASEWHVRLRERSVPSTPVRSVADFVEDDQLAALGMLVPLPHPDVPDLRVVGTPLNLDGVRPTSGRPPPRLGEHTEQVLVELGYSPQEIVALSRQHIVGDGEPS